MELPEVTSECRLLLANATQENKAMLEEALRIVESRRSERGSTTVSKFEKGVERDKILIHKHLLKGWEGMWEIDEETGKPILQDGEKVAIEFSSENAWDFLEQCPGWIVTLIRDWAKDPENFIDGPEVEEPIPHANDLGNS